MICTILDHHKQYNSQTISWLTGGNGEPSSIECLLGMDWAVIGSTGGVPAVETVLV